MSNKAPVDVRGLGSSLLVIGLAVLVGVAAIGGFWAWESVGEGEVKIIKNKGAVTGQYLEPGWHFITPVFETTKSITTRPQTYTMSAEGGEGQQGGDDSVRVLTSDGLAVDVDVTVRYRVTPALAPRFHSEYRDMATAEERLIRPTVRSELRTEGGNIDVTEIYTGEGQTRLKLAVEAALHDEFNGSGLTLQTVQIRNVHLPNEYAAAIEQKKVREQAIEEAEYEIRVAEKNKERDIIEAEAEAEQIRITGDALSKNPEVLELRYIEALAQNDNTVYVTGSQGMSFVKDVDSETNNSGGD